MNKGIKNRYRNYFGIILNLQEESNNYVPLLHKVNPSSSLFYVWKNKNDAEIFLDAHVDEKDKGKCLIEKVGNDEVINAIKLIEGQVNFEISEYNFYSDTGQRGILYRFNVIISSQMLRKVVEFL